MSLLLSSLPAPTREYTSRKAATAAETDDAQLASTTQSSVPPYGKRKGYIPRKDADFGGGGAFPEILMAQYPLGMGRKDRGGGGSGTSKTLALTTNAEGDIQYDVILKQGKNKDKNIASEHKALVPKIDRIAKGEGMEKPAEEEVIETAKDTAKAIEAVLTRKLAAKQTSAVPSQPGEATYIKYTPANINASHNSGASTRIIKMMDMPVDPLEPPKFRITKVPRPTGSPPVPVMHSPPRPLSAKDHADWKVPPCVSNWKNAKGYTIPLDKRLAADGRGLQETQINDGFAKFTEALYIAEQKARESIEVRTKLQRERQLREKETKEVELRELAAKARMERVGPAAGAAGRVAADGTVERGEAAAPEVAAGAVSSDDDEEEGVDARERARIREERRRERERDRRREAAGGRKSALHRDRDRDISEKIALGMANVKQGEVLYDQRLFNQEGGLASGLAGEDTYNVYDKPLYTDRGSNLYRPKKAADDEEAVLPEEEGPRRFKPDKGFSGADYGKGGSGGPVQFEKGRDDVDEDVFGLNTLMEDVKAGAKRKGEGGDREDGKSRRR